MTQLQIAIAGFSAVSTVLMFLAYAVFIRVPGKSVLSIFSCALMVSGLFAIQVGHLQYFQAGQRPSTWLTTAPAYSSFLRHSSSLVAGPSCRRKRSSR